MSKIIERVADAIRDVNADTEGLSYTELTTNMARAAIAAMREPTEEMMRYAEGYCDFILPDAVGENTPDGRVAEFTMGYQMAIDVALGDYPQ